MCLTLGTTLKTRWPLRADAAPGAACFGKQGEGHQFLWLRTLIPLSEDGWDSCMHGLIMKTHCSCNISVLLFNIWYIWSNVFTMQTKKLINLFNQSQSRNIVNTMDLLYLITNLPFRRGTTILNFVYYYSDKDIKSFVTSFKTHITLLPSF